MNWHLIFMLAACFSFLVGFWPDSKTEKFMSLGFALLVAASLAK